MAKLGAEPPDEVLVVAAILGDLDAFDELAARYRAAVVRTAQAIVGREDAEDVAQDALLLAFKALPIDRRAAEVRCVALGHHASSGASIQQTRALSSGWTTSTWMSFCSNRFRRWGIRSLRVPRAMTS